MKKLFALLICILFPFSLCACSSEPEYQTTPSGYMLSPGIPCEVNESFAYEVVDYQDELVTVIDEAEVLVKKWWNNDDTFSRPNIVWCNILYGDVRGFQSDDYLFLNVIGVERNDLLATAIHEWLHYLVDENTLIVPNGYGRPLLEMVVEAITVDILDGIVDVAPTDEYLCFKQTSELWSKKAELIEAFRNSEDFTVYPRIFGDKHIEILESIQYTFG